MTTELTKAAQQALEALEAVMRHVRREAPHLTGKLWGFADSSADALRRALTQRPAAQTEREAFEAWATSIGYHTERDMFQRDKYQSSITWELWRVWQARASLPAPQQATPEPVGEALQGGLDNDALLNAWRSKLPGDPLRAHWNGPTGTTSTRLCKP